MLEKEFLGVECVAQAKQQFSAGEYLFREGDPPGAAFLIESGRVEVSIQQGAQSVVLSYLGEGELLGEMAVIDDAPRSATARAVDASVVTRIERESINERLAEADPIIAVLMQKLLSRYRAGLQAARGQAIGPSAKADAESGLLKRAMHKIRLESQLMDAIENDELSVVFQPIYDVVHHRVAGFEALTRWMHPTMGAISPSEFIALAEETSLIMPVGQYALRKACEAIKTMPEGLDYAFVAVNISGRQSAIPDFADLIVNEARAAKVDVSRLELEITESLTLDYKLVRGLIERCHAHRLSVALDDFGTGFSNLGHLHELSFDKVKLDQAFTRQILENERCMELVRGIINMILAIRANVLAEGVETLAQAKVLQSMGVRYLQGWHVGKPIAQAQIPEALRIKLADL